MFKYLWALARGLFFIPLINTAYAESIPLDLSKWHKVKYSKIKPNKDKNTNEALLISVNKSSSALVYKFDKPKKVKSLTVALKLIGKLNYKNKTPGEKEAEDFPIRIGLILSGDKQLNFFQRAIAPKWLIKLNDLGKKSGGFDKIYSLIFYDKKPKFDYREHPLSKYFQEKVATQLTDKGIEYTHNYKKPMKAIGLWISADGDDTNSSFEVEIKKLDLN